MRNVDAGMVGVGAAMVLATIGALWKVARLRADVFAEFHTRTALAQSGLDERAATALRELALTASRLVGDIDTDGRLRPLNVIGDPAELKHQVGLFDRALRARERIPRYFERLLLVGPVLVVVLSILLLGELATLSYFSGWRRQRVVGYVGLWTSLGAAGLAVVAGGYYAWLLQRFSGAEILSAPAVQDD